MTIDKQSESLYIVQDNEILGHKVSLFPLPINQNQCCGAQKNHLRETILLSTHNMCFESEIREVHYLLEMLAYLKPSPTYMPKIICFRKYKQSGNTL